MTPRQLAQWLANLPADTVIYANDTWSAQQCGAVFGKVKTDRQAYDDLYQALERADADLAGIANDCALENFSDPLTDEHLGYWSALRHQLAHAAGCIWEDAGRNANAETGLSVY